MAKGQEKGQMGENLLNRTAVLTEEQVEGKKVKMTEFSVAGA